MNTVQVSPSRTKRLGGAWPWWLVAGLALLWTAIILVVVL